MDTLKIEGRITYQDLEGGFWGIRAHDGSKFVPVEPLPGEFKEDGIAVKAVLKPASVLGTSMWGKHVHVVSLSHTDG